MDMKLAVTFLLTLFITTSLKASDIEDFKEMFSRVDGRTIAEIEIAAKSGNIDEQAILGLSYSNGINVQRNKKTAEKWYLLAANQGHEDAQYNLGQMYRSGDLGQPDYKKAIFWYEKAASNRISFAASSIAGMHYEGKGVEKNILQATSWMMTAKHFGDDAAKQNLSILKNSMTPNEYKKAEELSKRWLKKNIPSNLKDSTGNLYKITYKTEGASLSSKTAPSIFLSKTCKAVSQKQGQGLWGYYRGRTSIIFAKNSFITFPGQKVKIRGCSFEPNL